MAGQIAGEAVKNRWITYSKTEGLTVNFGLKDFIVTFAMLTISPNIPAVLHIIELVTS